MVKPILSWETFDGKESEEVRVFTENTELKKLIQDLKDTARAAGAVSLSAPQIGVLEQVMVILNGDEYLAIINPCVTRCAKETQLHLEACLSADRKDYYPVACIERPKYISFYMYDETGRFIPDAEAYDKQAVMILHEIDNMDGKTFFKMGKNDLDSKLYSGQILTSKEERNSLRIANRKTIAREGKVLVKK